MTGAYETVTTRPLMLNRLVIQHTGPKHPPYVINPIATTDNHNTHVGEVCRDPPSAGLESWAADVALLRALDQFMGHRSTGTEMNTG